MNNITITMEYYDDDGVRLEVDLPAKHEVCEMCKGAGYIPEWTERALLEDKPEKRKCSNCGGTRVTKEFDDDAFTYEQRDFYELAMKELHDDWNESQMRASGRVF